MRVGDIVVANALLQHDLDASPFFPRYEVPLLERTHFDADSALSDALAAAALAFIETEGDALAERFAVVRRACIAGWWSAATSSSRVTRQ